jgi:GH18 family chitinase
MRAKTTLALEQGGGIMIWELASDTQDGSSLLKAIRETIQKR